MATKKCPHCGKSIAAAAQYCIFCSHRFDDDSVVQAVPKSDTVDVVKRTNTKNCHATIWLVVFLFAIALITALVVYMVFFDDLSDQTTVEPPVTTSSSTATTIVRDPAYDMWLHSFKGYWVDESSVGKGDIAKQGGQVLIINDITDDTVRFDLISYSSESAPAYVNNVSAILEENVLSFSFKDDGCGHAGEGRMRLRDGAIDIEVITMGQEALSDGEHSLKMNTTFSRTDLPRSEGFDISTLVTLPEVVAIAGEQTAESVHDQMNGVTVYTFGMLQAAVGVDDVIKSLRVDYSVGDNKTKYCYDCVDGTMSYDVIKAYFGEAEHDYIEQPTDIRVLHYLISEKASVTFTFDAQSNLLIYIIYNP